MVLTAKNFMNDGSSIHSSVRISTSIPPPEGRTIPEETLL